MKFSSFGLIDFHLNMLTLWNPSIYKHYATIYRHYAFKAIQIGRGVGCEQATDRRV